jgi:hypothetical protein
MGQLVPLSRGGCPSSSPSRPTRPSRLWASRSRLWASLRCRLRATTPSNSSRLWARPSPAGYGPAAAAAARHARQRGAAQRADPAAASGGLYKLNPVDPSSHIRKCVVKTVRQIFVVGEGQEGAYRYIILFVTSQKLQVFFIGRLRGHSLS